MDEIMIPKRWVSIVLVMIGLGAGVLWGVPNVLRKILEKVCIPLIKVLTHYEELDRTTSQSNFIVYSKSWTKFDRFQDRRDTELIVQTSGL